MCFISSWCFNCIKITKTTTIWVIYCSERTLVVYSRWNGVCRTASFLRQELITIYYVRWTILEEIAFLPFGGTKNWSWKGGAVKGGMTLNVFSCIFLYYMSREFEVWLLEIEMHPFWGFHNNVLLEDNFFLFGRDMLMRKFFSSSEVLCLTNHWKWQKKKGTSNYCVWIKNYFVLVDFSTF